MRPTLSVTTRLTTYVAALVNLCVMIRVPLQLESPGQFTIAEPSPKFHASLVIVCPCAVDEDDASNTMSSTIVGVAGEKVKLDVGAGGLPIASAVAADVVDCPMSSVTVSCTL